MDLRIFFLVLLVVGADAKRGSSSSSEESSSGNDADEARDASSDGADDNSGRPRVNCKGRGDKYCYKSWEEKDCPGACKSKCVPGRRMRSDIWSSIKDRQYDQVFVRSDKVCVARCKHGRHGCGKQVTYKGNKYCLAIRCDVGQVEGCHSDTDFEVPSCEACAFLFPSACKNRGSSSESSESSESSSSSSSS